jgi:hypothetical protein
MAELRRHSLMAHSAPWGTDLLSEEMQKTLEFPEFFAYPVVLFDPI